MSLTDTAKTWQQILTSASNLAQSEPALAQLLDDTIQQHSSYQSALAALIIRNLTRSALYTATLPDIVNEAISCDESITLNSLADIQATMDRDPACRNIVEVFIFYRGFKGLQSYRIARYLWNQGRTTLARHLQSLIVDSYQMDLHPGARIEGGVFIDHGTGIVIGETAQVERNVSMLHDVTLGGTGKSSGLRHPHIQEGVLLGAGCKVLGRINIGRNSKVAAGSIVLEDVPDNTTAVGIPARLISKDSNEVPAYEMKHEVDGR